MKTFLIEIFAPKWFYKVLLGHFDKVKSPSSKLMSHKLWLKYFQKFNGPVIGL